MNDPLRPTGTTSITNHDVCRDFYERHKGARIEVGDGFNLLDADQWYEVVKVSFYRKNGKTNPLLVVEAECAVDDCTQSLQITIRPRDMQNCSGLVRTCAGHRSSGWRTPCVMAWVPGEHRDATMERRETRKLVKDQAKVAKRVKVERPLGVAQQEAQRVLDMADLLGDVDLVRVLAARLPRGSSMQDQRLAVARRALASLQRRGLATALA